MKPLIFLFPGQSSRDPEMFDRLRVVSPSVAERASVRLEQSGVSASDLTFDSNLEIQLAVFSASLAYLELATERGLLAVASAGMSLGEYTHLVHIGALAEPEASEVVAARGRAYDQGPDGAMIALQPVILGELEALVDRVRSDLGGGEELVAVSNVNSPSQCVVAGRREAVDRVAALAEEELFAVAHLIEHRIPMHMAGFRSVAEAFLSTLEAAGWLPPQLAYWPNVSGAPLVDPRRADFVGHLFRHVFQRVEWAHTIDRLIEAHPDAIFVEVGPRRVLSAVFGRRWHEGVRCFPLDLMQEVSAEAFERRIEEIRHAAG